jgi:hypothetical protein
MHKLKQITNCSKRRVFNLVSCDLILTPIYCNGCIGYLQNNCDVLANEYRYNCSGGYKLEMIVVLNYIRKTVVASH